jgi:hypothetical protein
MMSTLSVPTGRVCSLAPAVSGHFHLAFLSRPSFVSAIFHCMANTWQTFMHVGAFRIPASRRSQWLCAVVVLERNAFGPILAPFSFAVYAQPEPLLFSMRIPLQQS